VIDVATTRDRPGVTGLAGLAERGDDATAERLLADVYEVFGPDRVALASSFGAEDMVLVDLMSRLTERPRVFTLDTGRLPQETYDLMDATTRRYEIPIEVYFPDPAAVEAMVRAKGLNLFYDSVENRVECCRVRKVEPLLRALETVDAWVTGVRRDQTSSRADTPQFGADARRPGLWKVAPLAGWTEDEVWTYVRQHDVPYNALHDRGYPSVGCAPCTRAVAEGADPRSGRWWWEQGSDRECGLHLDMVPGRSAAAPTATLSGGGT
jgi:phosphoadenosine phosphosulfate reductase